MDYGSRLKRQVGNPSRRSSHHTRQSSFEGSRRQRRAQALRAILRSPGATSAHIADELAADPDDLEPLLGELVREGFVEMCDARYRPAP